MSHLTRGAWIEIDISMYTCEHILSHLTRGAWIEIDGDNLLSKIRYMSHLTRGAWIEIVTLYRIIVYTVCRTSHEVRGLKSAPWDA